MSDSRFDLFAVTAPGLEELAARELRGLDIQKCTPSLGGVGFRGGLREVYAANLWLRTASRVLVRMSRFHAASFSELESRAARLAWHAFVARGQPVRFRVTCHKSALYHSDAVAERLARSMGAAGSGFLGTAEEPDEDAVGEGSPSTSSEPATAEPGTGEGTRLDAAAQLFVVRVDHDMVSISADSSGALLHRRGYRQAVAKAPLRETLAAAMLLASGWDGAVPLLDPMCGSGTIAIEGAMLARRMAPGLRRGFAFSRWAGFRADVWESLCEGASDGELASSAAAIVASDRDAGAVRAAIANAERAGVSGDVEVLERPLSAASGAGDGGGWLITNPPYGLRVGADVRNLYARLGVMMRNEFHDWQLGMLSADRALERQLGLRLQRRFETSNGGIRVRFVTGRGSGSESETESGTEVPTVGVTDG